MTDRILRPAEVAEMLGVHRITLWRMRGRGEFPKPIKLGTRAKGFLESEVQAWLAGRVTDRDSGVQAVRQPRRR
ncbi:MAG: helix-turn-helix transcriptional regulator [Candidatus Binataceae bacterium]